MPSMTRAGYTPPKAPKAQPPKKPAEKPKKKKRKNKRRMSTAAIVSLLVFVIACAVAAGALFVYTQAAPYESAFLPGTMLLGYPLGGLNMDGARALLSKITDEDIAAFRVELTWGKQSYVLSGEDVGLRVDAEETLSALWQRGREGGMLARYVQMLQLAREPMIAQPVIAFDMTAADELLGLIEQDIACEAEDATVAFTPGSAAPFAYTTQRIGYEIDLAPVRSRIESAIASVQSATIELEPTAVYPSVTREELEAASVLRSRVVMQISADDAAYANVSLAADQLRGLRIEPGETLSFNEAVGERTADRGYRAALEPAYGENLSGPGGGVCQLSSALYQAALLGGVQIVEQHPAVRPVSYCEKGLEAAVSDHGVDLVLCNPTAYPMFLTARTYLEDGAAYVEVQFIGEALGARYALESAVTQTILIEEPVYVRDSEGAYARYLDERVPVGEAQEGYAVTVYRVTLDETGEETARESVAEETYEAVPPTIYVGVEARE